MNQYTLKEFWGGFMITPNTNDAQDGSTQTALYQN